MALVALPSMLAGAEMFETLSEPACAAAAQAGQVRPVVAGRVIFSQGDPGSGCHVLLDGRVKIVQSRPDGVQAIIRFVGPGEMFGTVAAMMGRPYPADAVAVTDGLEIVWTAGAMRRLMHAYPEIALGSMAAAGQRLMELQGRIGQLSGERVEQRLAHALIELLEKAGKPVVQGVDIDFPITRQDLAELTGSTLHTVSRTLAAWEDAQIVESARRHITVRRPEMLRTIAASER